MPYVRADTKPRTTPVERISDESVYPLIDSEIQRIPERLGVFLLYDSNGPICVDYGNMQNGVQTARPQHPEATRFRLIQSCKDPQSMAQLVEVLKKDHGLIRTQPIGFSPSASKTP